MSSLQSNQIYQHAPGPLFLGPKWTASLLVLKAIPLMYSQT